MCITHVVVVTTSVLFLGLYSITFPKYVKACVGESLQKHDISMINWSTLTRFGEE